jgi:hypothetical protein
MNSSMITQMILKMLKENPQQAVDMVKDLYQEYKGTQIVTGAMDLLNMVLADLDSTVEPFEDRRVVARFRMFKKYIAVGFTSEEAVQMMSIDASIYSNLIKSAQNAKVSSSSK